MDYFRKEECYMRDENLQKMSALADRTIADPSTAAILLCYMLYQMTAPMDMDMMYDVAVTSGIINYFAFQEALENMTENQSVTCCVHQNGEKTYFLTEKGMDTAQRLQHMAGKSYRERITTLVQEVVKRQKNQEQVRISYECIPQGCHLHIRIMDHKLTLLELTLFTPDEHQAKLLGDKILEHPEAIYQDVLQAVMQQK